MVSSLSGAVENKPRIDRIFKEHDKINVIGAMMIVWRVRGKIIRSVLCSIVCSAMHTHMNRPNSCLLVRLSFSVVISSVTFYVKFSFSDYFVL